MTQLLDCPAVQLRDTPLGRVVRVSASDVFNVPLAPLTQPLTTERQHQGKRRPHTRSYAEPDLYCFKPKGMAPRSDGQQS
jgi:hypothetical protein